VIERSERETPEHYYADAIASIREPAPVSV
jgi:hypothetical protein